MDDSQGLCLLQQDVEVPLPSLWEHIRWISQGHCAAMI